MTVIISADAIRNSFADLDDASIRRIALVAEALAELNDSDDRLPSWDADAYDPTPSDWAEYAAWSRSLDGGCGVSELTPDEQDLIAHTVSQDEYEDMLADDAFADRYGETWA